MDALGHQRFAIAGHDTGMRIGYALAADHPDRVDRLAVAEAAMPGVSPSPPLFGSTQANDRPWHFAFSRLAAVNEQLITGREDVYFGFQFAKAARKLPDDVVRYYAEALAADPEARRGSFAAYRALDATSAQNQQRKTRRLTLPVLAIGGAEGIGEGGREHEEARRRRRAERGLSRQRPLLPPGGSRGGGGGADRVPGPVPRLTGRGEPAPGRHDVAHQPLAAGDDAPARGRSSWQHNRRARGTAVVQERNRSCPSRAGCSPPRRR
jgi:hypothetical protein